MKLIKIEWLELPLKKYFYPYNLFYCSQFKYCYQINNNVYMYVQ